MSLSTFHARRVQRHTLPVACSPPTSLCWRPQGVCWGSAISGSSCHVWGRGLATRRVMAYDKFLTLELMGKGHVPLKDLNVTAKVPSLAAD